MTIKCRLCGLPLDSGLPAAQAQADLMQRMTEHLGRHKNEAAELAMLVELAPKLIASYLLLSRYVTIPPNETELWQTFRESERALLEVFGIAES